MMSSLNKSYFSCFLSHYSDIDKEGLFFYCCIISIKYIYPNPILKEWLNSLTSGNIILFDKKIKLFARKVEMISCFFKVLP